MEQIVETKWSSGNRWLYEEKGYVFTKKNDTLYVKVKDLSLNSHIKVKYTCDMCGKDLQGSYQMFNRSKDSLCCACATKTKSADKRKKSFEKVKETIESRGYQLLSTENDYKRNTSKLLCVCKEHGNFISTYKLIFKGCGCQTCGVKRRSGENHPFWNGGTTAIGHYLRDIIVPWTHQQLQRTGCKCELTGKYGTLNVHHMYSFSNIIKDTMEELQLDIRPNISDYSEDELQLIVVNFLKNNELKAKPIVMLESVHRDFHKFCGGTSKDTSFKQLEEFKKMFKEVV
jgi:hypothetical protein